MTVWGQGTTRGARKARAVALERDHYTCQRRLPGCTVQASIADHIEGTDELEAVCPSCHQHTTTEQPKTRRAKSTTRRSPRKRQPK